MLPVATAILRAVWPHEKASHLVLRAVLLLLIFITCPFLCLFVLSVSAAWASKPTQLSEAFFLFLQFLWHS